MWLTSMTNVANLRDNVADLHDNVDNVHNAIERMRQDIIAAMHREGLILLYNANASPMGVLYNPTVLQDGQAAELAAPNPRTCNELKTFTGFFLFYLTVLPSDLLFHSS